MVTPMGEKVVSVLFVCMGNICRSPTAEGVFRKLVREAGLADAIEIDSAGTSHYHVGDGPDTRATRAARARGVEIGGLKARRAEPEDFLKFDLVLAMDRANYRALSYMAGGAAREKLKMFLDFAPHHGTDVPDPYYGGEDGFERVLDLCEDAGRGLLDHLCAQHGLKQTA